MSVTMRRVIVAFVIGACLLPLVIPTPAGKPPQKKSLPELSNDVTSFMVTESPKFQRVTRFKNGLVYTKDGIYPQTEPIDPYFSVGQAKSHVIGRGIGIREIREQFGEPKEYAIFRLETAERMRDVRVQSTEPVTVAGVSGFESHAVALHYQTEAPLAVYQLMLFPENDAFVTIVGVVGTELRDEYYDEMQTMARSFRWQN